MKKRTTAEKKTVNRLRLCYRLLRQVKITNKKNKLNLRIKYAENSKTPNEQIINSMVLPPQNDAIKLTIISSHKATNNVPPIVVKSHFVWKANNVSATTTTAVNPTAIIT